jgi:hypothetical protein
MPPHESFLPTQIERVHEWSRGDGFLGAWPPLLRGKDPAFQIYIKRVAREERKVRL